MQRDAVFSETTTELDDYVRPLRTHRRVVALVALISLGFGVVAALAGPHRYTSSTAILINPISADPTATLESAGGSDDLASEVRIASSWTVMEAASVSLAEQSILITPETLDEQVRVSAAKASRVIDISYTASDPVVAQTATGAIAQSYLDFRTGLTETNKQAARDALDARLGGLQEQLAGIETRLGGLAEGSSARVLALVEQSTIQSELAAQQAALADLSTVTAGGATIIDRPLVPPTPDGLTGVQTAVGAGAGGIVLGVVIAYVLAAYGSETKPSRRRRPAAVEQPAPDEVTATGAQPQRSQPAADELLRAPKAGPGAATTASSHIPAPAPAAPRHLISPPPLGDLDPRPIPVATTPAPVDAGPATWDDVASSDPSDAPAPVTTTPAPVTTGAAPTAGPVQRTLTVADDLDVLLGRLRSLGAEGPVTMLTLSDSDLETSLAVGLDLADELQALGARVLIIDALIGRPSLGQLFDDPSGPGLDEVLTGKVTLRDAARTLPGLDGLDALSINPTSPPTVATMGGGAFERLLAEARLGYHAIVVIAGSLEDTRLVPALAALVDGVVVGTDLAPGAVPGNELVHRLAALPAPTWEILTSPLIPAPPVAVGAARM